jgi:protocatechuate 3,4-dioxygenase beta subunit
MVDPLAISSYVGSGFSRIFSNRLLFARTLTILLFGASVNAQTPPPTVARPGEVAAQPAPPLARTGTSVIRGRIVRAGGRPLPRVSVRVVGQSGRVARGSTTDAEGRYEIKDLAADSYTLSASREGYVTLEYGQRRAFERGTPLKLGEGEILDKIDLSLPRPGAIVGRVTDENGEAVEGTTIQVFQLQFVAGRRRLMRVAGVGGGQTNDLGRYRVYGLQPGQYIVSAGGNQPAQKSLPGYVATYFPGTMNPAAAQMVTVELSRDALGIDVPLAKVRTARISGIAFDAAGQPLRGGILLSPSERSGAAVEMPATTNPRADGSFDIPNVPPGEYVLQAVKPPVSMQPRTSEGEFASVFVTVDGKDLSGLVVRTSNGSTVTGRITFEGDVTGPSTALRAGLQPRDVGIMPRPVDFDASPLIGSGYRALIHDDWTFEMAGLTGPRQLVVTAPPGWSTKAIRHNGRDITDTPLPFGTKDESLTDVEVVVTNRAREIVGTVTDGRGQPVADYTVIVFAADPRRWYAQSRFMAFARPGSDAAFTIRGLPPADYFVVAVDRMQGTEGSGEWQDPMFLDAMAPRATRVTLTEGQTLPVSLKLVTR